MVVVGKDPAAAFRTSWEKVCHSVEYVVSGGLEHRTRAPIRAIGVDELQYAKGRQYRTLVYQIDAGLSRWFIIIQITSRTE